MPYTRLSETIIIGTLFLFFLQSLSDFIEAIYAFGLLVTAFTVEVVSIVLFFTPLLFLIVHKPPSKLFLLGISYLAILARLLEPMLSPMDKLVASGISVGAFMLLFPALLQSRIYAVGLQIGNGLVMAVSLSILFRTANSSLDLSESGMFQLISWLLAILAAGLLWFTDFLSPQETSLTKSPSGVRVTGLAIGLASVILLIYFGFASPTVIARWTEISYTMIVSVLVIVLVVFSWLMNSGYFSSRLTRSTLQVWNLLFILALVLTILPHQIIFPQIKSVYPFVAPAASPLGVVFLILMLVFSPVIYIDFIVFARQVAVEKPSLYQIGVSFAIASLFFLVIVFFHVFTSIYDYAPVIGPFFRNRFWLVYFLVGIGVGLPVLLVHSAILPLQSPKVNHAPPFILGSLAVLSILSLFFTTSRPLAKQTTDDLRIMTYNIHQGYDVTGNKNLEGQLAAIKYVNPDILGLQESDTARVANGNVDSVRYFADHLDMYSYYGPTTTTGTFGIALLSKYPLQNPRTFFMFSTGEQTAAIQAEIAVDGQAYQIFVTHLGNGGPIIQLENLLTRIGDARNVIAMGDFNFEPTTDQYALITKTLADSWLLKWPDGQEISGLTPNERIDHIFVSPGMMVTESEYVMDKASDHPYMYIVIEP